MSRKHSKRRMFLKCAIIAFLVLFFISSAFLGLEIWDRHQGEFSQIDMIEETVEFEEETVVLEDETVSLEEKENSNESGGQNETT